MFYENIVVDNQVATAATNGNICNEDGVNNNNLQISIVKCRISNTGAKDYVNDLANANQTVNRDSKLDKLIAEIDNINFDEVASNATSQRYQPSQAFTQGDYLNEIKFNRKKNTVTSSCNGCTLGTRPNTRLASCSSSMPRVVKLDPNKYEVLLFCKRAPLTRIIYSIYSNFPSAEHKSSNASGSSPVDNSLKLYGKKM